MFLLLAKTVSALLFLVDALVRVEALAVIHRYRVGLVGDCFGGGWLEGV